MPKQRISKAILAWRFPFLLGGLSSYKNFTGTNFTVFYDAVDRHLADFKLPHKQVSANVCILDDDKSWNNYNQNSRKTVR